MHIPVLLHESLDGLLLKKGGTYVDCTVNRAGHSKEIAKVIGAQGTLVCIDLDQHALAEAKETLESFPEHPQLYFVNGNFRNCKSILEDLHITHVDGVLADLGLSSQELDKSGRGFTFRYDEPLQMTFISDVNDSVLTAADIVNDWKEETIADILYGYADEQYSRRIARAIVDRRISKPITTTHQLVEIIASAVPATYRHRGTHEATKTFQALRMAVNDELGAVTDLINTLPDILAPEGRACIITFHSTEDRIVKNLLRSHAETLNIINKKAIKPSDEECRDNPRARSAQLRIVARK